MNRDNIATFRAFIFLFLILQELVHAFIFQFFKIFHHAHTITFSVTHIKTIQILTRHILTFKTEIDFILRKFFAASFDETILVARKTTWTMGYFASFFRNSSWICKIPFANPTIHSAWRDKFSLEFSFLHKQPMKRKRLNFFACSKKRRFCGRTRKLSFVNLDSKRVWQQVLETNRMNFYQPLWASLDFAERLELNRHACMR